MLSPSSLNSHRRQESIFISMRTYCAVGVVLLLFIGGQVINGDQEMTTDVSAAGDSLMVNPTEFYTMAAAAAAGNDLPAEAESAADSQEISLDSSREAFNSNETKALDSDPFEDEQHNSVVFVGDTYVPVSTQLRSRPISSSSGGGSSSSVGGAAADQISASTDWRLHNSFEGWGDARRQLYNSTRVQHIEAECQDDYMKIRIGFNGSFGGLLYSSGYSYDADCVYINGTGRDYYEFYIQLNRCGTLGKNSRQEDARKNPAKNLMWNTVTVQYNPMIEEEWDEHFKVTCEYGYDFWKTVTFPFLDVEVATGNPVVFTLSPPECYMEIRYGYGTSGNRVAAPVRVGDPLTLIIYMRSKYDGFDIVVNDCYAHNGANKRIQLIDQYGCPVDDKLISRFRGSWSETGVFETQVFAYMKTFRFTGSPALYIECDVRMCHGRCPSQPCHWRNARNIVRRSADEVSAADSPVSQNINLFQSLRVLQEGELGDEFNNNNSNKSASYYNSNTADSGGIGSSSVVGGGSASPLPLCIRHGLLTALSAFGSIMLCLLSLAFSIACYNAKAHRQPMTSFFANTSKSCTSTTPPSKRFVPTCSAANEQ